MRLHDRHGHPQAAGRRFGPVACPPGLKSETWATQLWFGGADVIATREAPLDAVFWLCIRAGDNARCGEVPAAYPKTGFSQPVKVVPCSPFVIPADPHAPLIASLLWP